MLSNNSLYAWSASVTSGETVSFGSGVSFFCSVTDVDVVCVLRLFDAVHAVRNNVPTHAKILHIFFMVISPMCKNYAITLSVINCRLIYYFSMISKSTKSVSQPVFSDRGIVILFCRVNVSASNSKIFPNSVVVSVFGVTIAAALFPK